jgi:hypothetical protein
MDRFDWMFGTQMPNALAALSATLVAIYMVTKRGQLSGVRVCVSAVLTLLVWAVLGAKNLAHTLLIDWPNATGAALTEAYRSFGGILAWVAVSQAVLSIAFVLLGLRMTGWRLRVRRPASADVAGGMLLFVGLTLAYAVFCSSEWSYAYGSGFHDGYQVTSPWIHWAFWLVLIAGAFMVIKRIIRLRGTMR